MMVLDVVYLEHDGTHVKSFRGEKLKWVTVDDKLQIIDNEKKIAEFNEGVWQWVMSSEDVELTTPTSGGTYSLTWQNNPNTDWPH